jgi:hypothetical protein
MRTGYHVLRVHTTLSSCGRVTAKWLETLFLVTKIRGKDHIDTINAKIMVAQFCLDREQNKEALEMSGQGKFVHENNSRVKSCGVKET